MRGRHLLKPLPLLTPNPPSRPPAAHFRARAAAHPPTPRRAPLAEPDVGISRFASSVPGFRGALKQRYSDFVVHEVALDGALVRLTSFDLPDGEESGDNAEDGDPDAAADPSRALESFRLLCGEADYDALRGFLERVSEGGGGDLSPIILSADADKAHRSEVHEFIKRNFKFLNTDTVEHSDGIQKCIRVRLGSGPRGWRGRNRRGVGSSCWRDDKPFDSRSSTSWPYHLGKFLRFHLYKENKDTQEALGVIGKMLGVQPRSFGFAGTKDKRAVRAPAVYGSKLFYAFNVAIVPGTIHCDLVSMEKQVPGKEPTPCAIKKYITLTHDCSNGSNRHERLSIQISTIKVKYTVK